MTIWRYSILESCFLGSRVPNWAIVGKNVRKFSDCSRFLVLEQKCQKFSQCFRFSTWVQKCQKILLLFQKSEAHPKYHFPAYTKHLSSRKSSDIFDFASTEISWHFCPILEFWNNLTKTGLKISAYQGNFRIWTVKSLYIILLDNVKIA